MRSLHNFFRKKFLFILISLLVSMQLVAQKPQKNNLPAVDTTIDYDELFSVLDAFFDSLYTPRSFGVINMGVKNSFYNYKTNSSITSYEEPTFTPSFGYYHKSGLGANVSSSIVKDAARFTPYEYAISGSYDYLKNRKLATGLTLTHFFTKDSLPFYTSPLQSEAVIYFLYRKYWLKPMFTVNYGWGNRTSYSKNEGYITKLKNKKHTIRIPTTTTTTTQENINDITITASVKHDFYWLNLVSKKDYIRLTPQLTFTGGTEKFGFNESSNMYISNSKTGVNVLYNSQNVYLNSSSKFQALALTAFLKSEFSIGKFFVQPQLVLNYYFPAPDNKLTPNFMVNAGVIL